MKSLEESIAVAMECTDTAVSIRLAVALNCNCYGIDGIADFIAASSAKAQEYGVESLCRFETGDIREKIKTSDQFDVIVLGAIGPVFGDYYETLTTLSKHLQQEGMIIINDGYMDSSSAFRHPALLYRNELLMQARQARMELIEEHTGAPADDLESKYMLLEAGFERVREVWRNGNTVILIAEK
jgi:protein-L-isoaspartate O-methyltransferase